MAARKLQVVSDEATNDGEDTEQEARAWVQTAPRAYLLCRQFGHHWTNEDRLYTIDRWHTGRQLECSRCHMVRVDIIRQGQYGCAYRRYLPPQGYSRTASAGHSTAVPRNVVWDAVLQGSPKAKATQEVRDIYDYFSRHQ
jgi:hypothetical protein